MYQELRLLNFRSILQYEDIPVAKFKDELMMAPYRCNGFCLDCEHEGFVSANSNPVLMSHGCSTADFERLLGPLPNKNINAPIMFVGENPGGNYGNCSKAVFHEVIKWPPVNHYYWTPSIRNWPSSAEETRSNPYGDYLAYLMMRFGLANAYITNCVKCKYGASDYWSTAKMCISKYLKEEIRIFEPVMIFCLGTAADKLVYKYAGIGGDRKTCLLHPRVLDDPRQRKNYPGPADYYNENNRRIVDALKRIGLFSDERQ